MHIKELEYHKPESLADACALLKDNGGKAKVLAGGTDVRLDLKQGLSDAGHLVSLEKIPELVQIECKNGTLLIGSMVTPGMLAGSDLVKKKFPGLSDAAASMAGAQIRNLATIGGNICSAVPSADLAPPLFAAGAELDLVGPSGERTLPIMEFFLGPRETAIAPAEILKAVRIPLLSGETGTSYEKFQLRGASALAVVSVAALVSVKAGIIETARVAVGAAAPTPLLIDEAEGLLSGAEPSDDNFCRAGEAASKAVRPITDHRGTKEYRFKLTRVLTVRALKKAFSRTKERGTK